MQDFHAAAARHYDDATLLDRHGRLANADQLAGFALECTLKETLVGFLTELSDLSLLFGLDNSQTWNGYRELFRQWGGNYELTRRIRERLRMVAAMVPATREEEYLGEFRDNAQLLFSESLYDEAGADDPDAFNPSVADEEAPHSPLPILFSTDLVGVDVARGAEWLYQDFVGAAFSPFLQGAADLILGGDS